MESGNGGTNLDEPRPDFKRKVRTTRVNPITGIVEQYMPTKERCAKIASSFSIVAMMVRFVSFLSLKKILTKHTVKWILTSGDFE